MSAQLQPRLYDDIVRESVKFKASLDALADSIVSLGSQIQATLKQQDVLEATIRTSGGVVDVDAIHSKLLGVIDQGLFLETQGKFGRLRSPWSADELRQSNHANLKVLGRRYHEMVVRAAREIGHSEPTPPKAP